MVVSPDSMTASAFSLMALQTSEISARVGMGEVIIVCETDPVSFRSLYSLPEGLRVWGPWDGKLDNGGEQIELQDATGETLSHFAYKDSWFKSTDGQGYSLSVKDPINTEVTDWGQKATWQPSELPGGSPGY